MPGRQSHGRPLLSAGKNAGKKNDWKQQTNSKHRKHNLDAFSIASRQVSTKTKGVRTRDLDPELEQKRRRDDDDEDEENDEDDDGPSKKPQNKKQKMDGDFETFDSEEEVDTDGEGNEFRIGVDDDDDDESIDSDEAFGESDEERFEGYTFRGSSSKPNANVDEDDEESFGEDGIDLSQAMEQDIEEEEEGSDGDSESGSEESRSASESPDTDEEDEDDEDPAKLHALQEVVSGYSGPTKQENDVPPGQKLKIGLEDLALFGVKDPNIKKSLKLMKKEEKSTKPGSAKKLDVPLGRRQESKALRIAAREKANETLNRWQDTVKSNRRAEHLVFPLPESLPSAGLDKAELLPLNQKTAGTELEKTIMSIMEESGLGPSKPKATIGEDGEALPGPSQEELREAAQARRRAREVQTREAARAARIKKIKSKAYRRVHRRQRAHEELALREEEEANGEIDSDDEREAQHRRRAMERVGARHKESKWAKLGKGNRRAAWDDDYRAGLTEMARRDDELRRRVEGRGEGSDEDDGALSDSASGDDGDTNQLLLKELEDLKGLDGDTGRSKIFEMPFMKRVEEAQKKLNDETVADIIKTLNSNGEVEDDDEQEDTETVRRSYGVSGIAGAKTTKAASKRSQPSTKLFVPPPQIAPFSQETNAPIRNPFTQSGVQAAQKRAANPQTLRGVWSMAQPRQHRKAKKQGVASRETLSTEDAELAVSKPKARTQPAEAKASESDDSDGEGHTVSHPLQIKDIALADKAFGAEEVEVDFVKEKADVEEDDDDKIVDGSLPGWGSWVGDGVSKRAVKRDQKRFQKVVKGVNKTDRKDAKLERVIISEKRVHKNDKYLASGLPYEFENKHQYERSLRLPIGPEWQTKETFQDATKPRIILKQGIIAPMAKPKL